MEIKSIKRPWQKTQRKKQSDPFYNSSDWRSIRNTFMNSPALYKLPPIHEVNYSNLYCYECWKKGIMNLERIEIDHIIEIKDGGSRSNFSNLRSLCHAHHNRKTHNERKRRENL